MLIVNDYQEIFSFYRYFCSIYDKRLIFQSLNEHHVFNSFKSVIFVSRNLKDMNNFRLLDENHKLFRIRMPDLKN